MKLLIITYSYTPDLTPRAFRWSAVAAQLAARGHEVHVLCAATPGKEAADDGVMVHRVRDWLLNGSGRVAAGAQGGAALPVAGIKSRMKNLLRKTVRVLWRTLYWPDYACGWVLPARGAARALHAEKGFDWIISSSHPFSGHLVALLAWGGKPQPRWFVDISDPFCLMKEPSPYNRLLYGWLSQFVEGRVVAAADVVSVTTESTARLYAEHFPRSRGKTHVIPPLLSLPPTPARTRAPDSVIRMVFVGTLYRNLRSPRYLLLCLEALKAAHPGRGVEVHFYGAVNDCGPDFLACPDSIRNSVFVHGLVERKVVLQAMVDADILVNIGNDSEAQLASKVVEYMAVGRPILNLVSVVQDTSVEALADYPAVLTLFRDLNGPSPEAVAALARFVSNLPAVPAHCAESVRLAYAPGRIALQYAGFLEEGAQA